MGLVDQQHLRDNLESRGTYLAQDPRPGFQHPKVMTKLVRNVTVKSDFIQYDRAFSFDSDEAIDRGGAEVGPSPMRYFLSGIAFCQVGWYAKGSAALGVDLDVFDVDLETFMDQRGEYGNFEIPRNPQYLILTARVTSTAPSEKVLEMIDWGDARCPLWVGITKAIPGYERVIHNGRLIRDTVPDPIPSSETTVPAVAAA